MNYHVLYKNLYDPSILLLHKGHISFELIELILESLEASVNSFEEDRQVRKKFNNILMESFQNLGHHSQKNTLSNTDLLMVVSRKRFYKIITGNLVETSAVEGLKEQLELVNSMDSQELRKYYKKIMSEEGFSEKGTAGLGFIDMARKTKQKLEYNFFEMDDDKSYFSFEVKIKKEAVLA